ncbi:MAG: LysR family transcriptional regulator [Actinomycetota bacterium]
MSIEAKRCQIDRTVNEGELKYSARVLPDLSIRQFEYLVAACDSATWADAAASVGVSASALSQGLAELERRIGVDLFERVGRRRHLRPVAEPVLDHARQVLALTADLARWSERMASGSAGRVRLGMIDVAAVDHFPDVLARFRTERPDAELVLRVEPSGPLVDALRAGDLDLVVCVAPPDVVEGVVTEPLFEEPLFVHAPPSTPAAVFRDASRWGPWVTFPEGSHSRGEIVAALAARGAPAAIAAESHQPEVLREMVRLGLGWTVLARAEGDDDLAVGPEVVSRHLVLARRMGAVVDPAVDVIATMLAGHASATVTSRV